MTYNKPEVVKLDSAVNAIQGISGKPSTFYTDANPRNSNKALTSMAYEADE